MRQPKWAFSRCMDATANQLIPIGKGTKLFPIIPMTPINYPPRIPFLQIWGATKYHAHEGAHFLLAMTNRYSTGRRTLARPTSAYLEKKN